MGTLEQIAHFQGRRDEVPNQALAAKLATGKDQEGIQEIAANLGHELPAVRADCLKVLYEIGYLQPELIASYAEAFLDLLGSKNNRLVWGAMIALATIAPLRADELCSQFDEIVQAFSRGSVITRDNGVKVIAAIAVHAQPCRDRALRTLLDHLATCRPKDVPQHAEGAKQAFAGTKAGTLAEVLRQRLSELSTPQRRRVERVLEDLESAGKDS